MSPAVKLIPLGRVFDLETWFFFPPDQSGVPESSFEDDAEEEEVGLDDDAAAAAAEAEEDCFPKKETFLASLAPFEPFFLLLVFFFLSSLSEEFEEEVPLVLVVFVGELSLLFPFTAFLAPFTAFVILSPILDLNAAIAALVFPLEVGFVDEGGGSGALAAAAWIVARGGRFDTFGVVPPLGLGEKGRIESGSASGEDELESLTKEVEEGGGGEVGEEEEEEGPEELLREEEVERTVDGEVEELLSFLEAKAEEEEELEPFFEPLVLHERNDAFVEANADDIRDERLLEEEEEDGSDGSGGGGPSDKGVESGSTNQSGFSELLLSSASDNP